MFKPSYDLKRYTMCMKNKQMEAREGANFQNFPIAKTQFINKLRK